MISRYTHLQIICDGRPCRAPAWSKDGDAEMIDAIEPHKANYLPMLRRQARKLGWLISKKRQLCPACKKAYA